MLQQVIRKNEFAQKRTLSAGDLGRRSRQQPHFLHVNTNKDIMGNSQSKIEML